MALLKFLLMAGSNLKGIHLSPPRKRQRIKPDACTIPIQMKVDKLRLNQQESNCDGIVVLYFNDGNQVDVAGNILCLAEHLGHIKEQCNLGEQKEEYEQENEQSFTEDYLEQEVADLEDAILLQGSTCRSAEMTPLLHQITTAHLELLSKTVIEILVRAAAHR
jgi:hypothetical protein